MPKYLVDIKLIHTVEIEMADEKGIIDIIQKEIQAYGSLEAFKPSPVRRVEVFRVTERK